MGKNTGTTKVKTPKTVEVKLLVPYAVIVVLITLAVGFIGGWNTQLGYNHDMRQQFENGVASVKQLKSNDSK